MVSIEVLMIRVLVHWTFKTLKSLELSLTVSYLKLNTAGGEVYRAVGTVGTS